MVVAVKGLATREGGTGHSWDVGMLLWGLAFGLCCREPELSSSTLQLYACTVTSPVRGENAWSHFIVVLSIMVLFLCKQRHRKVHSLCSLWLCPLWSRLAWPPALWFGIRLGSCAQQHSPCLAPCLCEEVLAHGRTVSGSGRCCLWADLE